MACGPSAGSDRSRTPRSRCNCSGVRQEAGLDGDSSFRRTGWGSSSRPGVRLSNAAGLTRRSASRRPAQGREARKSPCQHLHYVYQLIPALTLRGARRRRCSCHDSRCRPTAVAVSGRYYTGCARRWWFPGLAGSGSRWIRRKLSSPGLATRARSAATALSGLLLPRAELGVPVAERRGRAAFPRHRQRQWPVPRWPRRRRRADAGRSASRWSGR